MLQVRTPLNGCLASAEMLLETDLGPEQRELAKTIRVSGSILLSTVSNFLDFFKIEAGKQLDVVRTEMDVQVPLLALSSPLQTASSAFPLPGDAVRSTCTIGAPLAPAGRPILICAWLNRPAGVCAVSMV